MRDLTERESVHNVAKMSC